jgi:hypothetical protein
MTLSAANAMDVLFIFRTLRQRFGRAPSRSSAARAGTPSVFSQAAAEAPVARVQPAPVARMGAPAVAAPKLRTLEEVRADLARLRLSARERHAQARVWRDTNFAPTDFMELASH